MEIAIFCHFPSESVRKSYLCESNADRPQPFHIGPLRSMSTAAQYNQGIPQKKWSFLYHVPYLMANGTCHAASHFNLCPCWSWPLQLVLVFFLSSTSSNVALAPVEDCIITAFFQLPGATPTLHTTLEHSPTILLPSAFNVSGAQSHKC